MKALFMETSWFSTRCSEPATLNPYGNMDYGSHRILEHMFENLILMENMPPYQFKGKLAAVYSVASADKLSNTFDIREDARFSDGRSVTPADILFSFKVIRYASGINYIAWNIAQPIFRDKRVRRSMAHLTPRKSIIRDLIH